jgi:hypothetical protein
VLLESSPCFCFCFPLCDVPHTTPESHLFCCSCGPLLLQAKAAVQASYFGVPTAAITKPKESVVHAAGWTSSVQPALGGLKVRGGVLRC